jgi:cyanophycinase-like exopeptidase
MLERGLSTHRLPGQKKEKARITIHYACNATGSHKLPMWVIGKHKQPRCFRASGVKDVEALGIKWRANKKAWMTQEIMVD